MFHEQSFVCGDEICKKIAAFLFAGNELILVLHIWTLYNLFVAVYATRFNIKHLLTHTHAHTHAHTQCVYVFCVVLRRNRYISPYNLHLLAFITEGECVYFALRTDYLYIIQVGFRLSNVAFARKTSGRRLRPLKKAILVGDGRILDRKTLSLFSFLGE